MTLQQLARVLDIKQQVEQQGKIDSKLTSLFRQTHFYCQWSNIVNCSEDNPVCFNHLLGLPRKQGIEKPLFNYQKEWYDALLNRRLVFLLKCTSAGATEFMIRYMSWLCLKDDRLKGSRMVIVTGPNISVTQDILNRMKHLFIDSGIVNTFDMKEKILILNGVTISIVASEKLDGARGIANLSFFYSDESAFYRSKEQTELRDIAERYIAKSNPQIVLVSTPNKPGDIMEQIHLEPNSLYHKLYCDYEQCLRDGMFSEVEIELQKQSISFEREYNLKWLGSVGNIFRQEDIQRAIANQYSLREEDITSEYIPKFISVDCGFGSSDTGILVAQWKNQKLEIIHESSLSRPDFNDLIQHVTQLVSHYKNIKKILVDGSFPSFISHLKRRYEDQYDQYHLLKPEVQDRLIHTSIPLVVAINWSRHRKNMLEKAYSGLNNNMFRINEKFEKLIIALRTATSTPQETDYDKEKISWNDVLDAFLQLSLVLQNKEE